MYVLFDFFIKKNLHPPEHASFDVLLKFVKDKFIKKNIILEGQLVEYAIFLFDGRLQSLLLIKRSQKHKKIILETL